VSALLSLCPQTDEHYYVRPSDIAAADVSSNSDGLGIRVPGYQRKGCGFNSGAYRSRYRIWPGL